MEKTFTKIEVNLGMAERLVIDLAIEEALQIKIKATLAQKINCMRNGVLYQTRKEIKKVKITGTYYIGW